jgi:hypothetical protein
MLNFRQRMVVQKQQQKLKNNHDPFITAKKEYRTETISYLIRAISMYRTAITFFEPLSDEEKICREEIFKYTIDLEILEHGTYEERKEVIKKYGRGIS